jgi:hypothetical protein
MVALAGEVFEHLDAIFLGEHTLLRQIETEAELRGTEDTQQVIGNSRKIVLVDKIKIGIKFSVATVDMAQHDG